MTTTAAPLSLRPPLVTRVFALAWPCAAVAFLLVEFRPNDAGSWAFTVCFVVFGCLLGWRLFRHGVTGTDDGRLVVRNLVRTIQLRRDDIAEVVTARSAGRDSGSVVALRLRSGAMVRLDVTQVPLRGPLRRRLARHEDQVRNWVDGRPQPFL